VNLTGGALIGGSAGGGLLFDTESLINNAAITLSGDNSRVDVGLNSTDLTADVTFNNVTFTGSGNAPGQGVWVNNVGSDSNTIFNNVSFLNGLPVNLLNASVLVSGSLVNSGTLSFDDPENLSNQSSYMAISGTVTLTGSGVINLLNNSSGIPQHQIDANPSNAPATASLINVNNTIEGTAYIGENAYATSSLLMFTNEGTVIANGGDTLIIEPDADLGVVNTGLMKASAGGYLGLDGDVNSTGGITPINNTGGSIVSAGAGESAGPVHAGATGTSSIVELSTVDLTGGALTASGGGTLIFDTESIVNNAAISLSGDDSQVDIGVAGTGFTPDVTFNHVSFTGDGSPSGQGVWVSGTGGNGPTTWNNVSFLGGVPVDLVGASVLASGTLINTGLLSFDDPQSPSGASSALAISGTVMLTGSGTVNLLANKGAPGHVIDGDYGAANISQNVLVNVNNTITGTGYIGGTPLGSGSYSSALQFINEGTLRTSASNDLTLIAGPILKGGTASPIQNQGAVVIAAGSLTGVIGNYSQSAAGFLDLTLGALTSATLGNLGSAATYSHLDVSGTASLNGTFEVSLANGFSPQLGNVFSVVNAGYTSGQFSGYMGLLLSSSLVLEPSYSSKGLTLTVSTVTPGTTATLHPVTPGNSYTVTTGSTYAGITSTSTLAGGNATVTTLLGGTASATKAVTLNFQADGNLAAGKGGTLLSDIADFIGSGTDTYVLQISYNPASLAASANVNGLFLTWLNPNTNTWENAVLGNTGRSVAQQIIGAYNPAADFVLGDYGIDSIDDRVWAVVDDTGEFAVSLAIPEPHPCALLVLGAMIFLPVFLSHGRGRSPASPG
jgi:hypothetical protein